MTALMEMYLQGVSTLKVKAVTEELCGARVQFGDHEPDGAKLWTEELESSRSGA